MADTQKKLIDTIIDVAKDPNIAHPCEGATWHEIMNAFERGEYYGKNRPLTRAFKHWLEVSMSECRHRVSSGTYPYYDRLTAIYEDLGDEDKYPVCGCECGGCNPDLEESERNGSAYCSRCYIGDSLLLSHATPANACCNRCVLAQKTITKSANKQ